jgi:hypothetical protein
MEIIGITDIHGQIKAFEALVPVIRAADLVLIAGDITNFGREEEADAVISLFEQYSKKLFAVPGNCDYPEVDIYLTKRGINLHQKSDFLEKKCFIGAGGSLSTPVKTPLIYREEEYNAMLQALACEKKGADGFLISHQPPYNTKADKIMKVKHGGSKAIRLFIEQYQPLFCLTGHIHESRGIDAIGRTRIVNPGPFKD